MKILIINGPNLNLLGTREPDIYGQDTLEQIINYTNSNFDGQDVEILWFQSNHEGEIIDRLHGILKDKIDGVIINPGGYSHSSVAILDALKMVKCPIFEVHLSNTHSREEFRKNRITANAANFILEGLGRDTYTAAVSILINKEK